MIGTLRLPYHVSAVPAFVENGEWWSDDSEFQKFLATRFPVTDVSPADGPPGAKQLRDAAEALGGRIEWTEQPETGSGMVY